MSMALKTEWAIYSDNTDINLEIASLERYCVGKARVYKGDFDPESAMKMTTKLEFEVFIETDMDEFWDLVEEALDDESEN